MQNSLTHTQLLIAGCWADSAIDHRRDVLNPGAVVGMVAYANEQDIAQLADIAARRFCMGRHRTAIECAGLMRKAAVLLREHTETIARLLGQGKSLAETLVEAMNCADCARQRFARCGSLQQRTFQSDGRDPRFPRSGRGDREGQPLGLWIEQLCLYAFHSRRAPSRQRAQSWHVVDQPSRAGCAQDAVQRRLGLGLWPGRASLKSCSPIS